jgi:hypothetical protein
MKKAVLLLLLVLSAGYSRGAVQAQDTTIRYALAYGMFDQSLRVATYTDATQWVINILPARVVFGEIGGQWIEPKWSSDGRYLYMVTYEPESPSIATQLRRYDLQENKLERVVQIVDPLALGDDTELISVESLSPDGRFAWTLGLISQQNHLIDLENGDILLRSAPCPARALAWDADTLYAACTGALFSAPQIFAINLENGTVRNYLLSPASDLTAENPVAAYPQEGYLLNDGRLVVGSFSGPQPSIVGVISTEDYEGTYFGIGTSVRVNEDDSALAYYRGGHLIHINLKTLRTKDLGVAAPDGWGWDEDGETLNFWRVEESPAGVDILRVQADAREEETELLYEGIAPTRQAFSALRNAFALEFQLEIGTSYVEVYDNGGLRWVSDSEFPGSFATLNLTGNEVLNWSSDGAWVHLLFTPDQLTLQPRTVSVNTQTSETILSPHDRGQFTIQTPDDSWWLYTANSDLNTDQRDILMALNLETLAPQSLDPGGAFVRLVQYPLYYNFNWAPLPSDGIEPEVEATEEPEATPELTEAPEETETP